MTETPAVSGGKKRRRTKKRWFLHRRASPGAAPGTIVVDPEAPAPEIHVIAYGPAGVDEADVADVAGLERWLGRWPVVWIDVVGLGDARVLGDVAERLKLHRLVLEDVVNVHQRPKVEEYDDALFAVTRMLVGATSVETEQISLYVGADYVVSFQERPGDCLDQVRKRIRKRPGRIRERGPDYLAYAILDAITDAYFPTLEGYGEVLEALEDETIQRAGPETIARIHDLRRDLMMLRRAVWPMREMFSVMLRETTPVVSESTRVYLRDCYDHAVQLLDILESYREVASGLMDVYLSSVSHRMNEVMKVLTIIATIFIPMTFVAGIYGMNFDSAKSPYNMPELQWYFGYPACLLVMALIGGGMLVYFRRVGWLGAGRRRAQAAGEA